MNNSLEVVDENDNIIGIESREKVHLKELLHRDIHIWFITPKGEIIFQHRAKGKKLLPDKLDATVGGHVEMGDSYEKTAIKESEEETGINIDLSKLVFLLKMKNVALNETDGKIHQTIGVHYTYLYDGPIDDLMIEEDNAEGFEAWRIDDLPNLKEEDRNRFIPSILSEEMLAVFEKAKEILIK